MDRDRIPDFTEREQLLLMAAYLHLQPSPDRIIANCWRVLRQAMLWAGVLDAEIETIAGQGHHKVVDEWYRTLIDMARSRHGHEALIWVQGNLGGAKEPPAWPAFTGCNLTDKGRAHAERLRDAFPQYRA